MSQFIILLTVALLVSSFHMLAPDHWLPLTVISSARSYSKPRTYSLAATLGLSHAGTSIIVALAIFYAGLVLIHDYIGDLIILGQVLLIVIGIYFIVNGYREAEHTASAVTEKTVISLSAFPDLSLMPIVVSAASLTNIQISVILIVFTLSSAVSLTAMVVLADKSLGKAISKVPPKYIDYLIGAVLIATALLLRFI